MANIQSRDGQTLLDIAIRECGTIEAAWDIATANDVAITDLPDNVKITGVVNSRVVKYYTSNGIIPATGGVHREGERVLAFDNKTVLFNNKMIEI